MSQSLSYFIVLLVLKLKGIKKEFSNSPINFKKLRQEDVHEPKGKFFKDDKVRNFKILDTSITEFIEPKASSKLLIFIHGGAFISGPAQHHWDCIKKIYREAPQTIWLCNYPKAPETKIQEISDNIDSIYQAALEKYPTAQISLLGDSVGGTLVTALVQRLISKGIQIPNKVILISPVMDASMSNPEIEKIDKLDPMLSKAGVLSAKKMCAEDHGLKSPMISPLNGSFEGFPATFLFLAEHDITYPDQQLALQKMETAHINTRVIEGKKMPHIWPLLPVMKEAKIAMAELIDILKN